MNDAAHRAVYLADYTPPAFLVDHAHLTFRLAPSATRVVSRIRFRPNEACRTREFRLDGQHLKLISASIDGTPVSPSVDAEGLSCEVPDGSFLWEAEVEIDPASNTALEGLYMSNGMYCTQCEAQGFRRITYYPDRPDVMAPFRVRIEASEETPILLSNGNLEESGPGFAEWSDPWPKPSYLFALVAGDLRSHPDRFKTASGRDVDLNIWVRPGDENRCEYAMRALKRSMTWDEQVYGREYDLDVFNLVAVDDFNMGAMENKGLNIFNSKYVLASPETATDGDFELIESIVAHEYFHNWTGNRITCRDWFQLCLKEGLTVFRDQQFSGDQRSHPVKRIEDVLQLRARQFREDNGPLSHPVRPSSFVEINNFYTATVYEKGAEIIRMLKTLVGDDRYDAALNLYFGRHDGDAATIEDWIRVFEEVTGRNLTQFALWYSQAGTPRVRVSETFEDGTYSLHLEQVLPDTPGQTDKQPMVIPVAVGILNADGTEAVPTRILELDEAWATYSFDGFASKPIPSLLRGFSAPVILERDTSAEERAFLLAHDTDPFNKFEAGRQLAKNVLIAMVTEDAVAGPDYLEALERVARDDRLDPAFRALVLKLPSEDDIAQTLFDMGTTPDPMGIHYARERLAGALAQHLSSVLPGIYDEMDLPGPYTPDPKAAGCRALRLTTLALITRLDAGDAAERHFRQADNMTDELGALGCLIQADKAEEALSRFYRRWSHDRLVMDKWFGLQILRTNPLSAASTTDRLTKHELFDWKNPNRFRSVIGALTGNTAGFHAPSGEGYDLVADWLIRLDPVNPQTAARMTTAFETWRRYDPDRQAKIRSALTRIQQTPDLSRDSEEMVNRILGA